MGKYRGKCPYFQGKMFVRVIFLENIDTSHLIGYYIASFAGALNPAFRRENVVMRNKGGFVEELSDRLTADLVTGISSLVRKIVREAFLGGKEAPAVPDSAPVSSKARARPRGRPRKLWKKDSKKVRMTRNERLVAAVKKLGKASIKSIGKETGFDTRGIGGSLHSLVKKGRLKRPTSGVYRVA